MKIQILESGTEGREINPFGERPLHIFSDSPHWNKSEMYLNSKSYLEWKAAEDSRKVYQIENLFRDGDNPAIGEFIPNNWKPGTIHEAVLLENGKIKITG